jgi:hypothetical protein
MLYKDMRHRYASKVAKPKDQDPEEEFIETGLGTAEEKMIKRMAKECMRSS